MTLRQSRHVVHGKNGVARELLEQAILHHFFCAPQALFGGLKDHIQRARKLAVLRQMFGSGQQHGGVPVVAASVHDARVATGVSEACGFVDGQRIHVGAQADAALAGAFFELPHQPCAPQAPRDLIAPSAQLFCDQIAGAVFLVAHFGVPVNVAADRDELIGLGLQGVQFVVQKSIAGGVHGQSLWLIGVAD